ncbi:MAG: DUF6879 family protein [Streptosporangiaceae bacterium]
MTLLSGEAFRALFHAFDHTAFRLEVRESYYEREQVRQFLAGEQVDLSYMDSWLELIKRVRGEGKRVERVRVVSWPPSDYTRYGLWLVEHNIKAGEDIRYLSRNEVEMLPLYLPNYDFWLLDSRRLYAVRFDDRDSLLGAEQIDEPTAIVDAGTWRDAAWHYAVPPREFVKGIGVG